MKDKNLDGRHIFYQGYMFWPFPPPGDFFLSKLKNREEFEGLHEERKGKGGKRRTKKKHVKIP